jgi:hypothetical protein
MSTPSTRRIVSAAAGETACPTAGGTANVTERQRTHTLDYVPRVDLAR